MDYKDLKELQAHHKSVHERHIRMEEMEWFKNCQSTFSSNKPVYVSKLQALQTYFQDKVWTKIISEKGKQLRNLVGRRWATDTEITAIFDILNEQHSDALYFSARPTRFLYAFSKFKKKVHLVKESGTKLRYLYVAINVGCSCESGYYVADGKRNGCHWALLFADLEKCKCYYGDSLGWPLPTNLEEVVRPNINKIEEDLQVDLLNSIAVLNKVTEETQTCNNVCGIVTMIMAAVLSNCQECWPGISTSHPQHEWLLHPSDYSDFLRIMVMDWMMKDIVDIGILSEDRCDTNIHDGTNAAFMKHEDDNMQTDYGNKDDSKCNISDSDSDDFEESQSGTTMSKTKVPPLVYSLTLNQMYTVSLLTHLALHVNLK